MNLAIRASAMDHAVTKLDPKPRYINISYSTLAYVPDPLPDTLNHQLIQSIRDLLRLLGGETVYREAQDTTDGSVFVFSAGNDYKKRANSLLPTPDPDPRLVPDGSCLTGGFATLPPIGRKIPMSADSCRCSPRESL